MDIHSIHTKADYNTAISRIESLWNAAPGSVEADELEVLSILVDAYEAEHFSVAAPDPIEAIRFRMEQMGLSNKDLENMIGRSGRVSEILNRKRQLTLPMIRKLHDSLHIPAEVLIQH